MLRRCSVQASRLLFVRPASRWWGFAATIAVPKRTFSVPTSAINSSIFAEKNVAEMETSLRKKYFGMEGKVHQQQFERPLSSEVMVSMFNEASKVHDTKTIGLLVKQLAHSQQLGNTTLEQSLREQLLGDAIRYYVLERDTIAAANIIRRCDPAQVRIDEGTCRFLMNDLVSNFKWEHSFLLSLYMIMCDYKIPDKSIFFLTGGLLRKTDGTVKVLELVKLIALKRRDDLAGYFSYNKVNRFALSMGGGINASIVAGRPLESHAVVEAMAAVLGSLKGENSSSSSIVNSSISSGSNNISATAKMGVGASHWFSFSLSKFLVAIACAGNHRDIAADFIRLSVDEVASLQHRYKTSAYIGNGYESLDVPTLLRAYSQADSVDRRKVAPSRMYSKAPPADSHNNHRNSSSSRSDNGNSGNATSLHKSADDLSVLLLQLTIKHADLIFSMAKHNKRLCMDVMTNYWTLTYRARDTLMLAYPGVLELKQNKDKKRGNRGGEGGGSRDSSCGGKNNSNNNSNENNNNNSIIGNSYTEAKNNLLSLAHSDIQNVHDVTQHIHSVLSQFHNDSHLRHDDFVLPTGFQRRTLRLMCDELGLRSKLKYIKLGDSMPDHRFGVGELTVDRLSRKNFDQQLSGQYAVFVWKDNRDNFANMIPRSYPDLLLSDLTGHQLYEDTDRRFDGKPLYWEQILVHLNKLDDQTISMVSHKVLNAMRNFPSATWGLMWLSMLRQRNIPAPLGSFRSALKMCADRYDLYGLLELLHFVAEERELYTESPAYKAKLKEIRLMDRRDTLFLDSFEDSIDGDPFNDRINERPEHTGYAGGYNTGDTLNTFEWNKALLLAFRSKFAGYPKESYKSAFTEVMFLMKKCGVEQTTETMQTLLRFMIHTGHDPQVVTKLTERLYTDKSIPISHVECIALTSMLLSTLQDDRKLFDLSQPMYRYENYLYVYPSSLNKMMDLVFGCSYVTGMDFLKSFEAAWVDLHNATSRTEFFQLVDALISGGGTKEGKEGDGLERVTTGTEKEKEKGLHKNSTSTAASSSSVDLSRHSRRQELIGCSNSTLRDTVCLLGVYAAYLVGAQDGRFRDAYDLLYRVQLFADEARKNERRREAAGDASQESSNDDGGAGGGGAGGGYEGSGKNDDPEYAVRNFRAPPESGKR